MTAAIVFILYSGILYTLRSVSVIALIWSIHIFKYELIFDKVDFVLLFLEQKIILGYLLCLHRAKKV